MQFTLRATLPGMQLTLTGSEWELVDATRLVNSLLGAPNSTVPVAPTHTPVEALPEIPEGILAYASSWNEPWVREDCLERARTLYREFNNWEVVYQELLKQDGEGTTGG